MRVESDRQGHHSSEAPACHRCGIPLLEESTFCPYCERWLDDTPHRTGANSVLHAASSMGQRTLLAAGAVFFAIVAFGCLVAAFLI